VKSRFVVIAVTLMLPVAGCRRPAETSEQPVVPAATPAATPQPQPTQPQPPPSRLLTKGTDDVAVLMYHDVVPVKDVWFDVTTEEFEEQMNALEQAGANVVPLSEVVEHFRSGRPLPPRAVAITFDDNTLGIYENAFPILAARGWHSTHFVHTAKVGVKTVKDHISWDQLREMEATGLADVESHTVSHPPDLRALSDSELASELSDSRETIEAEMGHPVRFLAYTEGNADERVAAAARKAGYEAAWGEQRSWTSSPADAFSLPRFAPFRLDDVLRRLASDSRSPRSQVGPVPVRAAEDGLRWTAATIAGRKATVIEGAWPETPKGADSGGQAPADTLLFAADTFHRIAPNNHWALLGRPVVLISDSQALIAPYRHWMGESREGLQRYLPGVRFAAIGREWLLPEVTSASEGSRRSFRNPAFCGVTSTGRFVFGQANGRVPRSAFLQGLRSLNLENAVLLRG
jgi:peptidoglycan/xylan/chitin deacetylase (PgdA/CDA1 family)